MILIVLQPAKDKQWDIRGARYWLPPGKTAARTAFSKLKCKMKRSSSPFSRIEFGRDEPAAERWARNEQREDAALRQGAAVPTEPKRWIQDSK